MNEGQSTQKTTYPELSAPGFGEIIVGEEVHVKDIYITAAGELKSRDRDWARDATGSSHLVGIDELQIVCQGHPNPKLIIGTGYSGGLSLAADAEQYLRDNGIDFDARPTPAAVERFNRMEGPKAILAHITC